jgi:hypothetical protein
MKKIVSGVRYCMVAVFVCPALCVQSHAATILVGPDKTYKTPCDAAGVVKDGDTVEIAAGTYANQACTWSNNNLTLRGAAPYAHLTPPASISNGKALWVIAGNNTVVENIEFSGAAVTDKNGAGIRQEGDNLTVRHCYFHDNEDGILESNKPNSDIVLENSEFANNGYGDGYSHNIYIGNAKSFTLRFCYTHDAKEGHTVKSRAKTNYILYNRIMSATGTTSYEVTFPNGGTAYVIGNAIEQGQNTHNPAIIDYGSEYLAAHDSDFYIVNNTVVNTVNNGVFISLSHTQKPARVVNNLFVGPGTLYSGPVDTASNVWTNSPGFAAGGQYDYHLSATSPAVNRGIDPGSAKGFSLTPVSAYVYDCGGTARTVRDGAIDAGAFEYEPASVLVSPVNQFCLKKESPRCVFPGVIAGPHDRYFNLMGRISVPGTNGIHKIN